MAKETKILWGALVLAACLHGIFFFAIYPDTRIITEQDQGEYVRLSDHLLQNWNFDQHFGSVRVPLYPFFVALCRLIHDNLFFVLICQNLIGLTAILMMYRTGCLFSARTGAYAALFGAMNLNLALESNLILTESLFYPVFCLFLFLLFRYTLHQRLGDLLGAGTTLGVLTLIRPITMYFPPFLLLALIISGKKLLRYPLKALAHAVLFVIPFLMVISPWLMRNYHLYAKIGMTTQGKAHIVGYIIPYILQYEEHLDLNSARKKASSIWNAQEKKIPADKLSNPYAVDQVLKKFTVAYLRSVSWKTLAKVWFWGAMKNIFAPVTVEVSYILKMDRTLFHQSPGTTIPTQLYHFIFKNKNKAYGGLMVLGILGILVFRCIQGIGLFRLAGMQRDILLVCLLVFFYFLLISGPVGYAKYRVPFEPVFAFLTAMAFYRKEE